MTMCVEADAYQTGQGYMPKQSTYRPSQASEAPSIALTRAIESVVDALRPAFSAPKSVLITLFAGQSKDATQATDVNDQMSKDAATENVTGGDNKLTGSA